MVLPLECLKPKYIKILINDPTNIRFFFHLVVRERKLYRIIGNKKDIKIYLDESEEIRKQILFKLKKFEYHGAMVSPLEGPVLYCIIRATKPEIIVETGVANGASSTFILSALEKNNKGKLFSIDLPSKDIQTKEIDWLIPNNLKYR